MVDQGSIGQAAAGAMSLRAVARLADRPLAWAWRATAEKPTPKPQPAQDGAGDVALYVARDDALKAERQRFVAAAERILQLRELPKGVLRVRAVAPAQYAYAADLWTLGCVKDLPALAWPARRRLEFVRRVADVVERLHQAGIVHGCLCDENVLLDDDLEPVLAEAGALSVYDLSERGGDVASYVAFAAPEVVGGAEPDTRSDIYSVGRLLQHVLRSDDLPQVADVTRRCLAPAPAGRYATAAAVAAAIEGLIATLPVEPTAPRPTARSEAEAKPKHEGAPISAVRPAGVGPPAVWLAPVGLVVALGSVVVAAFGGGSSEAARSLLSVALLGGVALASLALRPHPRSSRALRASFALALVALVAAADPLSYAYRSAAERAIRASPESRRVAIAQLIRLGRDFQGMALDGADLSGLDLRGADLRLADLSRANLSGANLFGTMLQGASFADANLAATDLRLADLAHATHFESARCSTKTLLSDPFRCSGGVLTDAPPSDQAPSPPSPPPIEAPDGAVPARPAQLEGGPGPR